MNEQETYKDWSIKRMSVDVIRGIKQVALDNNQNVPDAVNDCLLAYQDANGYQTEEESWAE